MVILFDETSYPFHDAFSAYFVQACDDALNRAVTIFLLVRQQLERIDQVVTQPQAACASNTFARIVKDQVGEGVNNLEKSDCENFAEEKTDEIHGR